MFLYIFQCSYKGPLKGYLYTPQLRIGVRGWGEEGGEEEGGEEKRMRGEEEGGEAE